jgi:hypothetical protein
MQLLSYVSRTVCHTVLTASRAGVDDTRSKHHYDTHGALTASHRRLPYLYVLSWLITHAAAPTTRTPTAAPGAVTAGKHLRLAELLSCSAFK